MTEVFSTGGGTQSTAIAALIVQGRLPKPDITVIADTGREMPTTWEYLDAVTIPELAKVGVEVHRVKMEDYAFQSENGLWGSKGALLIPAYTTQEGKISKLSGFCSNAWKVHVINNWLSRDMGIKKKDCRRWIGFSMDESRRVLRMKNTKDWANGMIRFPLVHDVMMFRQDSIKLVTDMGWPEPPRSRCWMCPHQNDAEWRQVQARPELFEQACSLGEEIRKTDPHAWLHKSAAPLRDADLSAEEDLFSSSCPSGICFI